MARIKFVRTKEQWFLYWMRSDLKWHAHQLDQGPDRFGTARRDWSPRCRLRSSVARRECRNRIEGVFCRRSAVGQRPTQAGGAAELTVRSISRGCLMRILVSSGSPYEAQIGFSRAVRVGGVLAVAGTAPIEDGGGVSCPGDVFGQTKRCLELIIAAVVEAGLTPECVVRTRVMLTDIDRWKEAADAHGAVFAAIRPATTFVEVSRFINPGWLVEVEADCVDAR